MRYALAALALLFLQLSSSTSAFAARALAASGTCSGMTVGQLTSLNGFVPFQASSLWNTDISSAPLASNSANIINYIGSTVTLHPDFGSGLYDGSSIGIPYQIVSGSQAKVNITLGAYPDESDPGPMPIPSNALIEGYPAPGDGDRHVLVLDKDNCWLYEMYNSQELSVTQLERRLDRDLGHDDQRAASLHLDFGRRRGAAYFSRIGPLR